MPAGAAHPVTHAACALAVLAHNANTHHAIVGAGAVPALVYLLDNGPSDAAAVGVGCVQN